MGEKTDEPLGAGSDLHVDDLGTRVLIVSEGNRARSEQPTPHTPPRETPSDTVANQVIPHPPSKYSRVRGDAASDAIVDKVGRSGA